jgi:membrane-bound lytic murein transglycosylase D
VPANPTATSAEAGGTAATVVAEAGPAGAAAPREHTVRSGDTLWVLARRYGTTVRALADANGLRADRTLRLGIVLRIPD